MKAKPPRQRAQKRRRSIHEIYAEMLTVALQPSRKTEIMYRAYVSSRIINSYISELIKRGFLKYDKSGNLYQTTVEGNKFLANFREIEI